MRKSSKMILKTVNLLIENPAELLADIAFRFYKRFIFKDGGEGVERREKITVVIVTTVAMIVLGLILAVYAFIVLG